MRTLCRRTMMDGCKHEGGEQKNVALHRVVGKVLPCCLMTARLLPIQAFHR